MQSIVFSLLVATAALAQSGADCPGPLEEVAALGRQGSRIGLCTAARKMDVQGHRGIQGYPNNTIPSFEAGLQAGADTLELDLQITKDNPPRKDGRILVAHDPTLDPKRCGLPGGKPLNGTVLREMSFEDARRVQCAEKTLAAGAATAPMPTLSEVFDVLKDRKSLAGRPARLNIEIKYDRNHPEYFPSPEEYAERIIGDIRKSGWDKSRFIVQSFDQEILKIVKKKAPDIEVVPLVGDAKDAVKAVKNVGAKTVTTSFTQLTPEIVAELHKMGVKAIPWTVNSEEDMMRMISMGVDGIITDRADLFTKIRDGLCAGSQP